MPLLKPERWCDVIQVTDPFDRSKSGIKTHVVRAGMSRIDAEVFRVQYNPLVKWAYMFVVDAPC